MASRKITRHRASPITPPPANYRMEMTEDRQAAKAANRSSVPSQELAIAIAQMAADDKCTDVLVLDTRGLNPVSDYVIIASGTSDRQMRATCQHLEELGEQLGHPPYRSSKDQRAVWLLVDFVDVIFHVFEPNTRAHYDLEMMWGDAPRILWERPEGSRPPALATSGTMADRTAAVEQSSEWTEQGAEDSSPDAKSGSAADATAASAQPRAKRTAKKSSPKKSGAKKKPAPKRASTKSPSSKKPNAAAKKTAKAATTKSNPKSKAKAASKATAKVAGKAASGTKKKATHKGAPKQSSTKKPVAKASPAKAGPAKKASAKKAAPKKGASRPVGKPVGKSGGGAGKAAKKKPARR